MEDQPADPGDLTTDAAESETAPRRRRWGLLRRRSKAAAAAPVSTAEDTADATEDTAEPEDTKPEDTKPEPRKPMGKARRTAKPEAKAAPEPAGEVEQPADEAAEAETAETAAEPEESAEPAETGETAEETAETAEGQQILVPHRPAGKRLKIAAVTAGALFVGAAAFAGATLQPYLADRALIDTKLDVARTAANAITTLWTYTPDNMDSLPDRSAGYLGGDFAHEYRKYIDAIVAPNKQAQVTNTTEVKGAAVESLTPSEATAIVYTNSVATSPVTKNVPSLRYLSYRLTMERRDAKWLITRMSTVTSLDLTPQL